MPIGRYRSTCAKLGLTSIWNTTESWCTTAIPFYRAAITERTPNTHCVLGRSRSAMPISRYRSTCAKLGLTSIWNTTESWCTTAIPFYRAAISKRTPNTHCVLGRSRSAMPVGRYRSTCAKLGLTSIWNTTESWCTTAISFYRAAITERTSLTSVSVSRTMSVC